MGRTQTQDSGALNDDDIDKMIADATFYFLVADQKKSMVKRADLVKTCDLGKKERKVVEQVIESAKNHLLKTFGIRVEESETRKGNYFLINSLTENQEDDSNQHITWSDKENAQMALTFVILGLVFMSNGSKITEDNLFKFLKHMGVYEEDKKTGRRNDTVDDPIDPEVAELFEGDVKKFVNDILVSRQHYLVRSREDTGDPEAEVYSYTWGERAKLEIKESDVLRLVCDVYECEPRMFKEQFDRVINNEGPEVLDMES